MITFKRQPDNTFSKAGELEPGTRSVQLQIEDRAPFGSYSIIEALAIIDHGREFNQLKFDRYSILPAPRQIDDETAARLEVAAQKRKETKLKEKEDAMQDDNTIREELEGAPDEITNAPEVTAENTIKTSSGKGKSGKMAMHSRWHVKRGIVSETCEYCKTK